MNKYNVYLKLEPVFCNIEAEDKEEAIQIAKDQIFDEWGVEVEDEEVIKVETNED